MKITAVRVTPIAFKDPPLLNAAGIHEPYALRSIIEIETQCGRLGLGESYGDAPVLQDLLLAAPHLVGQSVFDLNGARRAVANHLSAPAQGLLPDATLALAPSTHSEKAFAKAFGAFETALLDCQAQIVGLPLVELLGGAVRQEVDYSAYLFFKYAKHIDADYPSDPWGQAISSPEIVAQAQRMIDLYGFGSIKLKAGALEPDHEAQCLEDLAKAFPHHPLRIDPNANWSLTTAERIAQRLGRLLEYYEDPTPSLEGMAQLHKATGLPLATNMVVTTFEEFKRSIAMNAVQIVLCDHHFWGGIRATQELARMCETFGLGVSMHSNSHLGISLMAMTHMAAAIPNVAYACDTHYPWQVEDVIEQGRVPIVNGKVRLTHTPGLGVTLDREKLRELHEQFLSCGITSRNDAAQMRKYHPNHTNKKPRF
ncbi:MAG: glucarate dehydratase [Brachymonas sp.]|nr:glucarate dehydratase [Brachymonas sp.]